MKQRISVQVTRILFYLIRNFVKSNTFPAKSSENFWFVFSSRNLINPIKFCPVSRQLC